MKDEGRHARGESKGERTEMVGGMRSDKFNSSGAGEEPPGAIGGAYPPAFGASPSGGGGSLYGSPPAWARHDSHHNSAGSGLGLQSQNI